MIESLRLAASPTSLVYTEPRGLQGVVDILALFTGRLRLVRGHSKLIESSDSNNINYI